MTTVTHHLQISGPEGKERFDVPEGVSIIGRQAGVEIVLDDQLVSRRHAQIECTEAGCTLTDLKSSNGTKANGTRLQPNDPVLLNPGDVIEIGAFALTYEQITIAPEPEPTPEPPAPSFADRRHDFDLAMFFEVNGQIRSRVVLDRLLPFMSSKQSSVGIWMVV